MVIEKTVMTVSWAKLGRIIHSRRWSLLLLLSLTVYLTAMFHGKLWVYGGVPAMEHPFADMHAILTASDANRDGYDVSQKIPYDTYGRPHIYSRVWLWLGYTGLTDRFTTSVSAIIVSMFLISSILILIPRGPGEFVLCACCLLSPAVMLGVERCNNDLIIFILLAAAVFLLARKTELAGWMGGGMLFLASVLKFYPAVGYIVLIRQVRENRKFWLQAAFFASALALFTWWSYNDIVRIHSLKYFHPLGRYTFGGALLFLRFGIEPPFSAIAYSLLGLFVLILALKLSSGFEAAVTTCSSINTLFFLTGASNLVFCFFANTNYDYRCIFYILTLPLLLECLRDKNKAASFRTTLYLLLAGIFVVLWSEFIVAAIRLAGKTTHLEAARDWLVQITVIAEQLCAWFSITVLLTMSFGILREPFRHKIQFLFSSK